MSLTSMTDALEKSLRSSRKAVLGRGGEISLTAGYEDLPEAIYKIPADASLAYRSDDSVAYRKVVPSGAEEYAQVAKVGGMTYKIETKLLDTKVTELVSEGANLIPYPFPYKETTLTRAGITFTDNGDGSITLNGTNDGTRHSSFSISRNSSTVSLPLKAGTYKGSTNVNGVKIQGTDGTKYYDFVTGVTLDADVELMGVYIQVNKGNTTTFSNTIVYPMLNRGSTAAPYKPYRAEAVDTFPISAELRAFLEPYGYGQGNPDNHDEYNYIDFEKKVFGYFGNVVDGVWVACENPTEIDISAYLPNDNFIKVEGGGVIKAVNEHEQDAPSTINYIEKVG